MNRLKKLICNYQTFIIWFSRSFIRICLLVFALDLRKACCQCFGCLCPPFCEYTPCRMICRQKLYCRHYIILKLLQMTIVYVGRKSLRELTRMDRSELSGGQLDLSLDILSFIRSIKIQQTACNVMYHIIILFKYFDKYLNCFEIIITFNESKFKLLKSIINIY